jgi:hypothetical protein
MNVTTWKFPKYKADPQQAYDEIMTLETITAENVVNLARNENSVIHDDFEWNDTVAGEKYRVLQAKEMLRMFVTENIKEDCEPIRAMFPVITKEDKREYKPTEIILKNVDEYQQLLKTALDELRAFKKKYKSLAELDNVMEEIEKVI